MRTFVCNPTVAANPTPKSGATVTIKDGGGVAVGSPCTSSTLDTVGQVLVTSAGSGYTSAPTLTISGGGGSGATATCTVFAGQITSVTLTNGGSGYTSNPTVSLGGPGTGGAISATLAEGCCVAVPSSGTYTATASYPGYVAKTVASGVTACALQTVTATMDLNVTKPATVHGTDSVYGTITVPLTSLNAYKGSRQNAFTGAFSPCDGLGPTTWTVFYKLFTSSCSAQLQISWYNCNAFDTLPADDTDPSLGLGRPERLMHTINSPTSISASPFQIVFTVPPDARTDAGQPYPYAAGATITLTP